MPVAIRLESIILLKLHVCLYSQLCSYMLLSIHYSKIMPIIYIISYSYKHKIIPGKLAIAANVNLIGLI